MRRSRNLGLMTARPMRRWLPRYLKCNNRFESKVLPYTKGLYQFYSNKEYKSIQRFNIKACLGTGQSE